MATAEYAIATLAAVGFAGLLVVILKGNEVKGLLLGIIRQALSSVTAASRRDRGSVTAELAVGLPAVVLLLVALLAVASSGDRADAVYRRCAGGCAGGRAR